MEVVALSRALMAAEPQGVHGTLATVFADGSSGERGASLFLTASRWAVRIDGAATMWSDGRRMAVRDRSGSSSGGGRTLPQRPPWSMVVPRQAGIYGRLEMVTPAWVETFEPGSPGAPPRGLAALAAGDAPPPGHGRAGA